MRAHGPPQIVNRKFVQAVIDAGESRVQGVDADM